jgi:hypothetical protein
VLISNLRALEIPLGTIQTMREARAAGLPL